LLIWKIVGRKEKEIKRSQRKLLNKKFPNLQEILSTRTKLVWHAVRMKLIRNSLKNFVGKTGGRSRYSSEDISKIDVTKDCEDVDWIHLTWIASSGKLL
jgi:hypothetical protein